MYLRLLIGRYAGEVRDLSPVAARAMLADGRAERVNEEPSEYPPASAPETATEAADAAPALESGKKADSGVAAPISAEKTKGKRR